MQQVQIPLFVRKRNKIYMAGNALTDFSAYFYTALLIYSFSVCACTFSQAS